MLRVAMLLMIIACGGSKPPPQAAAGPCQAACNETGATALVRNDCLECKRASAPWLMTCEEKCSFESEWYVGCLSACRGSEQAAGHAGFGMFRGDAGLGAFTGDAGINLFGGARD